MTQNVITITGPLQVGKSAISKIIQEALTRYNVNVTVEDPDGDAHKTGGIAAYDAGLLDESNWTIREVFVPEPKGPMLIDALLEKGLLAEFKAKFCRPIGSNGGFAIRSDVDLHDFLGYLSSHHLPTSWPVSEFNPG